MMNKREIKITGLLAKIFRLIFIAIYFLQINSPLPAQDEDAQVGADDENVEVVDLSEKEEADDLESLKSDVSEKPSGDEVSEDSPEKNKIDAKEIKEIDEESADKDNHDTDDSVEETGKTAEDEEEKEEKENVKQAENSEMSEQMETTADKNENEKKDSDLESLKSDISDNMQENADTDDIAEKQLDEPAKKGTKESDKIKEIVSDTIDGKPSSENDDHKVTEIINKEEDQKPTTVNLEAEIGNEEKKLLELAKFVEGKVPDKEWSDVTTSAKQEKYIVSEGEYLWKISKKLFGTGFYYAKIWSLNPYITNPHEVTPGMVLVFNTGDSNSMPEVRVGNYQNETGAEAVSSSNPLANAGARPWDFNEFGEDAEPEWIKERSRLMGKGIYVQYATNKTFEDLKHMSEKSLNKEYKKYTPPESNLILEIPADQYDETGFDKSSKINYKFKEGFYLNTFITSNLVQDLGVIDSSRNTSQQLTNYDLTYVRFNPEVKVVPGDKFSIYSTSGKMSHKQSDRTGYKYSIVGELKVVRKISHLWECQITDAVGKIYRKDRLTVHTPKIDKIIKTYNARVIEAMVIGSYDDQKTNYAFGDVVYLDRGRADGVELGNIFEIYSFMDQSTERNITPDPTYKIGEITVINLTDNFATGLVNFSSDQITLGSMVITKTAESAVLSGRIKDKKALKKIQKIEHKALDELDIELNLDDVSENLLKKADQVELSEEELEELEKQEREKSIIQKGERDIKELERLEKEIESAEKQLNSAKMDEDKLLENEDLNMVEKNSKAKSADEFDPLNEIEQNEGKKYMDRPLDVPENPYGLNETDIEEIDTLLESTPKKE